MSRRPVKSSKSYAKSANGNPAAPVASKPRHVDADGFLCLQGAHLWKWRALDAELRAAAVELVSTEHKILAVVAQHEQLSSLIQQKAGFAAVISHTRTEIQNTQAEIEKDLGISLKNYSFDDKTGRLHDLTPTVVQSAPVRKSTRK